MRVQITTAALLLLVAGALMAMLALGTGTIVGLTGVVTVAAMRSSGPMDPMALGGAGIVAAVQLVLLCGSLLAGAMAGVSGYRALMGDPRSLRAGSILVVGASALCMAPSCVGVCTGTGWSLPLVLGLVAAGLAYENAPADRDW